MCRYWEEWLVHRAVGKRNHMGAFEPNFGVSEALFVLPDEMVKVFLELDKVYGKMERQYLKQTAGKEGASNG